MSARTNSSGPLRAVQYSDARKNALSRGDGRLPAGLLPATPAGASAILTKYGATAFDWCVAPGVGNTMGIAVTDLTHSLSNERPRFSNYTRKLVLGATGSSEIRMYQIPAFDADATEKAFSFDIYVEGQVTEFNAPNNPYIDITISNSTTTGLGSNYSRWSVSSGSLRQGWNTIKIRQADNIDPAGVLGNMPTGVSHAADVGTGFDWSEVNTGTSRRYFKVGFTNMANMTVHLDQLRRPAKAKSILTIGFDSNGANNVDDVFPNRVAPLFAQYGIRSYFTFTYIYELIYAGTQSWDRMTALYTNNQWDALNHSWNHAATEIGRNTTLASLVFASDVGTATFPATHGIPIGRTFKARIRGASIGAANIVGTFTATGASAATYTAAGAGTGAATGTIKLNTFMSEVIDSDTTENRRIAKRELVDTALTMRGTGFSRAAGFIAYPNNCTPELNCLEYAAGIARIYLGREYRNGLTNVNEFGVDNPLKMGSFSLDSGAGGSRTSTIAAKVSAAIARGDHIHLYGHFILDDYDAAMSAYWPLGGNNGEYPPGNNGNPSPPAASLSGDGGWWYFTQLENLLTNTIAPAIANGTLVVMSPSEYLAHMGYPQG
jgi:hypothetical protein